MIALKNWLKNTIGTFRTGRFKIVELEEQSTSPECPNCVLEPVFQGDHQDLLQLHALHIQVMKNWLKNTIGTFRTGRFKIVELEEQFEKF
jgi:hypothetical protein